MIKIDPGFDILQPDDAVIWIYKYLDIAPYYADLYVSTISTAKDFGISLNQIEEHTKKLKEKLDIKNPDEHAEKLEFELNTLHLNPSDTKEERKETEKKCMVTYRDKGVKEDMSMNIIE